MVRFFSLNINVFIFVENDILLNKSNHFCSAPRPHSVLTKIYQTVHRCSPWSVHRWFICLPHLNYLRLLFNDQIPTISPFLYVVFLRLIHYFLSEVMHTIASGRQYKDLNLVLLRCCLTAVRHGGETLFLVLNGCASLRIF